MKIVNKKIIGWILYFAVVAGLIYGIPKALSYFLGTPYPMATITSESMWPALKKSDMVFIQKVGRKSLKAGDIIVFNNKNGFTIHRIVRLGEDTVTTKGDANDVSDTPVKYGEIIGKTVDWQNKPLRIPYIGNLTIWASKLRSSNPAIAKISL